MSATADRARRWERLVIAASILVAAIVLYFFYARFEEERLAAECEKGGMPFMERLFKEWLVGEWTKDSGRVDDGTLLPAGMRASDVETVGYITIYEPLGVVFYVGAGGGWGAAFHVRFDRTCGFKIVERQWCPNKSCSLPARVAAP